MYRSDTQRMPVTLCEERRISGINKVMARVTGRPKSFSRRPAIAPTKTKLKTVSVLLGQIYNRQNDEIDRRECKIYAKYRGGQPEKELRNQSQADARKSNQLIVNCDDTQ